MNSLAAAIENLYVSFSDIPKPEFIDACAHCFDEKELDKLLDSDLRNLSPDDLSSYASSAFLTAGDAPDYLYFLPRILEISLHELSWWPDFEVTGRAIREADWPSWPDGRLNALREFLGAAIRHLIETETYEEIDGWMCGIARAGLDIRPFLEIIETDNKAVCAYFVENAISLSKGKLANAFWERPNEGHDRIVDWLRSEKIARTLQEAFGYKM